MKNQDIIKKIKELRENSPKRNFNQTIDLIINLKHIDIKKPDQKIDSFIALNYDKGKNSKTCIFLDKQLESKAKGLFDKIINKDDFPIYTDKKQAKKIARTYDFFVAQNNLMTHVASTFGKFLGPLGKMPNPKSGCVVSPETNLEPLVKRLQKTVRLITKNEPIIKVTVGNQKMPDEEIADNISNVYNHLIHDLPQNESNIRSILIKFSMGPPVYLIGGKEKQNDRK